MIMIQARPFEYVRFRKEDLLAIMLVKEFWMY